MGVPADCQRERELEDVGFLRKNLFGLGADLLDLLQSWEDGVVEVVEGGLDTDLSVCFLHFNLIIIMCWRRFAHIYRENADLANAILMKTDGI